MLLVTAPERPISFERPAIFLAGGITDAPEWQPIAAELLGGAFATCFNPRRIDGFAPPDDPEYVQRYKEQVEWEHHYLLAVDIVLFWLPKEAPCITTRFELGWWFGLNFGLVNEFKRPFVVGVEPGVNGENYFRTALPASGIPVHSSLEATCEWACQLALQSGKP